MLPHLNLYWTIRRWNVDSFGPKLDCIGQLQIGRKSSSLMSRSLRSSVHPAKRESGEEPGLDAKYSVENLKPRVQKNGGGVMVWGCIWKGGVGPLVIFTE